MRPFFAAWPALRRRLGRRRTILLLLDFDGTLARLAPTPDAAALSPNVRRLLRRLNGGAGLRLAVLSGRALPDVRARVGLAAAYYGGNHGLELAGPGLRFLHPGAERLAAVLRGLSRTFRSEMSGLAGALVEDKRLSLALHDRLVPPSRRSAFRRKASRLAALASPHPFVWRRGRKVRELFPKIDWDKGRAAELLMSHLGEPFPIALGDDLTDEDMFRAVKGRGLAVRVGRRAASRADYYLPGQAAVPRFLASVGELMEARG